jgi:hypothetical protein
MRLGHTAGRGPPAGGQLSRWSSQGLLTQEQATAILAAEGTSVARQAGPASTTIVPVGTSGRRAD